MSKFLQRIFVCAALMALPYMAYADDFQVSNADFEDWSGAQFDGQIQPKGWNACNVEQVGFKFNFAHRETGRSGYCMMVQDQDVGAMGITETSPGYFSLGQPWAYVASITAINQATAGTSGGITWTHRPDSLVVWIKRTGSNTDKEDFYLLYYSWSGTAKSVKYKGKNGSCTSTGGYTDEESDIRQALNGNECGTNTMAKQIAEGMWREKKTYGSWTRMSVPIYYMNSDVPQKMNLIFSASNYPNFRANSGLYAGNSLYVDDVEMVYSSKIQKLFVGGIEWKGFDPNSSEVQTYALGESATSIPDIEAVRGVGSLTNARGTTVNFAGRTLSGSEISITKGNLTDQPTTIVVKSEDGKSTTTYKIQFQKAASSNAKLAGITVNGTAIDGFSPTKYNYDIDLPYGTKTAPVVGAEKQEEKQTVAITQPGSVTGSATIKVTAANGSATQTYTLNFKVGLLSDNELQDILVNGKSVPGFTPSQTVYKVSLPVTTTVMPTVTTVSKPEYGNDQTVVHTVPSEIDGGVYQLSVTTPGNKIAKVYKLNFKLEKSSYSYLKDLKVEGGYIAEFQPNNFTYYINLPMGTTSLPKITYTMGDEFQTVSVSELGAGVVDGTVRITVTAGNGDQSVYKLVFSTEKSDISTLNGIKIGGVALEGFSPEVTSYSYQLPVGTETLPEIEPILGDQYQTYAITTAGLNGKTRITVTAGDGSTTIYMIAFSVEVFSENTLQSLFLNGALIDGWNPETNEYWVNLPQGTTELPTVTYELKDPNFQTASVRTISGLNGDYKITVRPQSGASRTYIIHFSVATSSNTALKDLKVAGYSLQNDLGEDVAFDAEVLYYWVKLPEGVSKIPAVSFEKAESSQRVLSVLEDKVQKVTVTAQSGATRTYTVTFIVTVSQNAFLDSIYLDGKPMEGFEREKLSPYKITLTGETCPVITVKKAAGQQVTITAPYGEGVAQIKVQPEEGAANIYEITFVKASAASALLAGITIDGVGMVGFVPATMDYTREYVGSLPVVAGIKQHESQEVQVRWKGEVASLHVKDSVGNRAVYTITFTRQPQSNKTLQAILIDGTPLDKFKPEVLHYDSALAAGSTYPEVRYIAADNAQVVFFGQDSVGHWAITVADENGDTATYTMQFTILPYTDVTLENLVVEGYSFAFDPENGLYNDPAIFTIDQGKPLPKVTPTAKAGQTVVIFNVNDHEQQVLVRAENGDEKIYTIGYTRAVSANALLKAIYIDGEELLEFRPNIKDYTITLPHGRKVVPNVFPVGQLDNQTITTTFGRPNEVTTIHVVAQNGTDAEDYTISFPVAKSDTTLLKSLTINGEAKDVETTEFTFNVGFDQTEPHVVTYEQREGQLVHLVEGSLKGTTKIIVTNEKGDNSRTYSINYVVAEPQGDNKVKNVKYSYVNAASETVTGNIEPVPGNNPINLPFGAKDFQITEVEKNYAEQSIQYYKGSIRRGATIIATANRVGEDDVTYTLTPVIPTFEVTGKLEHLKYNGADVPHFRPDVYNYMINVTAQPTEADFAGTVAYGGKTVSFSAFDAKKKQVTISVDGGETYSVCWFYDGDKDPLDFSGAWVPTTDPVDFYTRDELKLKFWEKDVHTNIGSTGYKPSDAWTVPADIRGGMQWNLMSGVIPMIYYTGKEVISAGANGVMLSTLRGSSIEGSVPGMMTLGDMALEFVKSGGSSSSISETKDNAYPFRNTPDSMVFNYKPLSCMNINGWSAYIMTTDGENLSTKSTYSGSYSPLNVGGYASVPVMYNNLTHPISGIHITLNSAHSADAGQIAGGTIYTADLQMENLRLLYNSRLTNATVDGGASLDLEADKRTFITTVSDDYVGVPALAFTGAVHDQTQTIEWLNDGNWIDGKLTARVINYGENSKDSTHYYVVIQRTPVTSVDCDVDFGTLGTTIKGDTTFVKLPYGTKVLPDMKITPESPHQLITMTKKGNAVTVNVKAEDGAEKTTVYVFREIKDSDVDFESAMTAEDKYGNNLLLTTVDATNFIYSVETEEIPEIIYAKKAGQLVDINYTKDQIILKVTAQDGVTTRTYTINRLDPVVDTKGQIEEFVGDIKDLAGHDVPFGSSTYTATAKRPSTPILFTRSDSTDAVVFIQTPLKMEWQVTGTESHTYTLSYPTEPSATDTLSMIQINGIDLKDFLSYELNYDVYTDTTVLVDALSGEMVQNITTTPTTIEGGVEYAITVTAEDGAHYQIYRVNVRRPLSDIATLEGILLDSVLISDYDPAVTSYTVTLPLPADGVKRALPQMPNVTYVANNGQKVTVEPGELDGNKTFFTVVPENGDETKTKIYDLLIQSELSRCVDLTGITVNNEMVDQFEPGRHFYSRSLKTSDIVIDYTSDDRFQTVTTSVDTLVMNVITHDEGADTIVSEVRYTLHVQAEHGETADYEVTLYIENQSNDRTLANITLDGKNFVDFERALNADLTFNPDNNNYTINLPSGTTILPEVSAQLKMDGQKVTIDQKNDSVLLNVTAVDGSKNQYVLHFVIPLSKNADLSMIFLNGDSLPGFDPAYYFYQVELPVGTHELPEVAAQKAEAAQTILPIDIDNDKLQATIKVQAEDPTTRENTYVVVFHFTQSDADSLAMIYQDGKNLEGFTPANTYYALSLPVGTPAFPDLSWETADDWQTAKMDTVESSANQLIRQIIVTSESGKKKTYTVSYTILKSDIDTLQMIFVDQKQLEGFNARTEEYFYQLTASYAAELGGQVPLVEYISGDEYQTVLVSQVRDSIAGKSLGYKSIVTVTAATGATRTYTIHYPVEKSSEATLNMINLAGKPLANYDAERFNYKVEIGMEASVPAVTVIKKEEIQVVEISLVDDVVTILVMAEDGTTQTYTLNFERVMSDITTLRDIILTDGQGETMTYPFRPEIYSYTINIPYSADKPLEAQLPAIEPIVYDIQQTTDSVHHFMDNGDIRVDITVTAPDGENQAIYSLTFHFIKPSDATLVNILLKGTELPNFLPQVTEYTYAHPFGSTTADFFAPADVQAMLSDRLATFSITQNDEGTIFIRVVAQDGTTEITYAIVQTIAKDNDCLLSNIFIGEEEEPLKDFDPEVTFYTYYLREGSTTTPVVTAIRHADGDTIRDIRPVPAGDTCTILCVAEDGTAMRYYIHFAVSTISEAAEASGNDVIIKRLPNTNSIFVGTIRKDVYFVLFDQNGRILYNQLIPTANPNDIVMSGDLETVERLSDVVDTRSGLTIELNIEQIYFYTFLYGEKDFMQMVRGDRAKRLKSGKLILTR